MKAVSALIICLIACKWSYGEGTCKDSVRVSICDIKAANTAIDLLDSCEVALNLADSIIRVDSAIIAKQGLMIARNDSVVHLIELQRDNYNAALQLANMNVADLRTANNLHRRVARRRLWTGIGISAGIGLGAGFIGGYYVRR